jgi:LL-H family phage holin
MNQVNSLAEVVVAVVVAVIPFIFKQLEKWLEKNQTAKTVVSILPTIAKDAVVIAEKLGVEEKLASEVKNSQAVKSVSETLKNLGFTDVDEQIIKNAVESAYAELVKSGTLSVYKPDNKQETQQVEENKQEQPQTEQVIIK